MINAREIIKCAKNRLNPFRGAAPDIREIKAFCDTIPYLTLIFILRTYTDRLTPCDAKDTVWFKEVPFGVALLSNHSKGSTIGKNSSFWTPPEIPAEGEI